MCLPFLLLQKLHFSENVAIFLMFKFEENLSEFRECFQKMENNLDITEFAAKFSENSLKFLKGIFPIRSLGSASPPAASRQRRGHRGQPGPRVPGAGLPGGSRGPALRAARVRLAPSALGRGC